MGQLIQTSQDEKSSFVGHTNSYSITCYCGPSEWLPFWTHKRL